MPIITDLPYLFLIDAALVAAMMLGAWVHSLLTKDASWADFFWGLGFVLVALAGYVLTPGHALRKQLMLALTALWGLRLAAYIYLRKRGAGEDFRYQAMRKKHGEKFAWVSLFTVFGLQGALLLIIALPQQATMVAPTPTNLTFLDILGTAIFFLGFGCEAIADIQMARFKRNPANRSKVMDHGLWRYSRHPNYFGEAVLWWGLYLIALSNSGHWWVVISPVLITFLLLRVSGVPLLEEGLTQRREGYAEYVRRTRVFVPWFPRKN